ncbi:hypothetical protein HFP89_11475 [Wenzhouxiangella sp. XN79A]|uniref:hypothetical protein n=1 Tax=Wenzhouxiangella sp. XN79A TaxID=2724193 RepID=UPI00144A8A50|nr:hypothetical protein [Wenzhouxiangella sp. XN79A]NKI35782.1 hypothetical protein [Wenzhouxiangella sp. XN79A]
MSAAGPRGFGRFQGSVRNAILWGIGFGAIGLVLSMFAVSGEAGDGVPRWQIVASLAVRFSVIGVICGTVFWWGTGLLLSRRRFAASGRIPVVLCGAFGTAIFVPLFLQTMNLLSGDGIAPWPLVLDDAVWAFFFGGGAALGSLELARRWMQAGPEDSP